MPFSIDAIWCWCCSVSMLLGVNANQCQYCVVLSLLRINVAQYWCRLVLTPFSINSKWFWCHSVLITFCVDAICCWSCSVSMLLGVDAVQFWCRYVSMPLDVGRLSGRVTDWQSCGVVTSYGCMIMCDCLLILTSFKVSFGQNPNKHTPLAWRHTTEPALRAPTFFLMLGVVGKPGIGF